MPELSPAEYRSSVHPGGQYGRSHSLCQSVFGDIYSHE